MICHFLNINNGIYSFNKSLYYNSMFKYFIITLTLTSYCIEKQLVTLYNLTIYRAAVNTVAMFLIC